MALTWKVYFDWTTEGEFDTSRNDALNMTSYSVSRGRHQFIKENGEGLERVPAGYCQIKLDNSTGVYDPYNTSSVLYPKVEPGRYMTIKVEEGTYSWYRFTGCVESIETVGGASNPEVLITAYDGLKYLQNNVATTEMQSFHFSDTREDNLSAVLTGADFPSVYGTSSLSSVVPGKIHYFWSGDKDAYSTIAEIADTEAALYGCKNNGQFFYRSRTDTTSAITITQSDVLKDIDLPMPYNLKRNVAKVKYYPMDDSSIGTTVRVWKLLSVPYVGTSAEVTYWSKYKSNYNDEECACYSIDEPVATTDYKGNSKADGTGTDRTVFLYVDATNYGNKMSYKITNLSSTAGIYVTLARLRGQAIYFTEQAENNYDRSGTSATRLLTIDTPWMQDQINSYTGYVWAGIYDTYIQLQAAHTLKYPRFQIEDHPSIQFAFDLFDPIDVDIAKYGINQTYLVGAIEEEWLSDNGQAVLTTVYTEPEDNLA